jgi:succinoglycan biosynthesis protein ExoA
VAEALPSVTVIIAARPEQQQIKALDAARRLDYPREKLEIIIARGKQPSVQRNAAIRSARGEIIYFLDDDSVADPRNVRRAAAHFAVPHTEMVGGPNLCPADAPPIEQSFALAMGSWLAFASSCARYRKTGILRSTSEKELILCNLFARRAPLMELGGFDESLYPNEENALMDALQRRGGKLLYDPEVIVYRRPRATLKAFVKMLLNYGRGRAEQFRLHPTPGSLPNLVPALFCVYLAAAPFLRGWWLAPLVAYGVAVLAQTIAVLMGNPASLFFRVAGTIVLAHVFYGLGFWRGLFTRPKANQAAAEVRLETVPS